MIKIQEMREMSKKARLMIVEDEIIVAKDVQRRLQALGYTVVDIANSGKKAINIAKETEPDLILMDIRLKGKGNGIETAGKIHELSDIPIVYMTAYSDENTVERAKRTERSQEDKENDKEALDEVRRK